MARESVQIADKETVDKIYEAVTSSSSQTVFLEEPYHIDLAKFGKAGSAYHDKISMTTLFENVKSCNNKVIAPFLYDFGVDNNLHMGKFFKRIKGLEDIAELDNLATLDDIGMNATVADAIKANAFVTALNLKIGGLASITDKSFANISYTDMKKMIDWHYAGVINIEDYWNVGDTRSVAFSAMSTVTGIDETHSAHSQLITIIGFNHDTLTAGGTGAVSLQLKNTLPTPGVMNTTNTNTTGWTSCPRRTWCNSIFYNALPTDLRNMIKQVVKHTSAGNRSTTINTTNDYCFLISEVEVFGTPTYSVAGEGTQYDYYKTDTNRIKYYADTTSAHNWWVRSPHSGNAGYFCYVNISGTAYLTTSAANSSRSLSPGFVI